MKTMLLFAILLGFLSIGAAAFPEAGYKRSPWGSKTWDGPGTPPHFSPQPPTANRPVDPGWGVRPPHHRAERWGRVYYHERQPAETIIIERETQVPVYAPTVPARKQASPLRCGGRTATRTDPLTGELIIEYVSSSRECPQ